MHGMTIGLTAALIAHVHRITIGQIGRDLPSKLTDVQRKVGYKSAIKLE